MAAAVLVVVVAVVALDNGSARGATEAPAATEQVDQRILSWILRRRWWHEDDEQPSFAHLRTPEKVFARLVAPVVQASCVGCHKEGGAAAGTRLRFVTAARRHSGAMNLRAFEAFLSRVEGGAALLLDTIRDPMHGGGVQIAEGTDEFAAMTRLLTLLDDYVAVEDEGDVFVYRLFGEDQFSLAGLSLAAVGDTDGDGLGELVVGSENFEDPRNRSWFPGKAYVVSGRDLVAADRAHGPRNRVISLAAFAGQRYSWTVEGPDRSDDLVGSALARAGDLTGDGLGDIWVGARGRGDFAGEVHLVSPPRAAAATGDDGKLRLADIAGDDDGWVLEGEAASDNAGRAIASADVDGDGFPDVLIGAPWHGDGGAVYVVSGRSLSAADLLDGEGDRRVGLGAVAAQADSWKLLSEGEEDLLGIQLANAGDLDGDSREDFLVAATGRSRSTVYLVAAASLEGADAADGSSDGVVQIGRLANGRTSWQLVGRPGPHREGRHLAANDLDGDGYAEILIGGWERELFADANAYVLAVSDLPAADRADGQADGVVELERAAAEAGSYRLTGDIGGTLTVASMDFDGDGAGDVVIGAPDWGWTPGVSFRPSPTDIYLPGAAYLVSGADLAAAAAGAGSIDLESVAALPKSWKVVGASGRASDHLGSSVGSAGDLDGDGIAELALGFPHQALAYLGFGSAAGPGGVVVLSGADLALADSKDGTDDGVVHLNALGIPQFGELPEPTVLEQYGEHVVVIHVPRVSSRTFGLRLDHLTRLFLAEYEDVFDYLLFVSNLPLSDRRYAYSGLYVTVSNADEGVGASRLDHMPSNRLRGYIHFTHPGAIDYAGAHEIMHGWGNFVIDTPYRPHWGISSVNGQLGGFDPDELVDLGDGRYVAGEFSRWGDFSPASNNSIPYGPLELYLAGWIPAEEMPDILIARDARWTGEREGASAVFSAAEMETWSVERFVEQYGPRVPTHEDAQRTFRAAAILLVEEEHPATDEALAGVAGEVRRFGLRGNDEHESVNFWEATGGRASIGTGDLSAARRGGSSVPRRMADPVTIFPDETSAGEIVGRAHTHPWEQARPARPHVDDVPGVMRNGQPEGGQPQRPRHPR